jgi:hypothetical protein
VEEAQPLRLEASLERTPGEVRQDVLGGPSTSMSGVESRVLLGERRTGRKVAGGASSDS